MHMTDEKLQPIPRKYYTTALDITDWNVVEAELKELLQYKVDSADDLISMLEQATELGQIIGDEMSWRYIHMTLNADDDTYEKNYTDFYSGIVSKMMPYNFELQKKFYDNPYRKQLDPGKYNHLNQIISNYIELFREENIPLKIQETELNNRYGSIYGKMTVVFDGQERTLTQLGTYLKNPDRKLREEAWMLRMKKMQESSSELDKLFDELKTIRVQMAKNAGFDNYRDYMHRSMGRFAYTPDDLMNFHDAVEKTVIPFLKEKTEHRRKVLGLESVRPWDTAVDLDGKILKPFETTEEFVEKAISILNKVNPEYGLQLNKMLNTGLLDLENRKGKAPGGYNNGLNELGSSFIFMNAVKLHRDVVTLLHESGHAMHSMSMPNISIDYYRETPSEVAELASMSMELLTMEYWDEYYANPDDLKKAKRDQLEGTLAFMPWCMTVDAFQHWIYTHPDHTPQERQEYFLSLSERFGVGIDWTGLVDLRKIAWMFQLHIFEVPFYYIEYGMAQLGALAIYKNYKQNGKKAVDAYQSFLELGYSKPVNELYKAAGIRFDFSSQYLQELVDFVKDELKGLE